MAKPGKLPGAQKSGGRQKGAPNKRTLELQEILKNNDFCPVTKLMNVYDEALRSYADGQEDRAAMLGIAQRCASDLMPYLYPKRKAVELEPETGKTLVDILKSIGE